MPLLKTYIFYFVYVLLLVNCNIALSHKYKSDPEVYMNVTEVINLYKYPCENHLVTTEDGYILSIQRIPFGIKKSSTSKRPVVFLQHGLLDSSFTWVNNAPDKSLAFILADNGFDVWLANSRGNVYSNKHVIYPTDSNKFWDFSWDEMAKYDLSASIEYVLSITKSDKLSYIGHSQGTEIIFAKLSQNSSLNSKISSVVALAPVAFLGHVRSGIKYFAHIAGGLDILLKIFGHGEFLPSSRFMKDLVSYVCGEKAPMLCENFLFLLAGYDTSNLNYTRLPIYLAHTPAETSAKNMVHYAQSYESNEFEMYDYGIFGNLYYYHSIHPPKYLLNAHGVPLALFWGGNDWLADSDDVSAAIKILGKDVKLNRFISYYNHLDFVWGENAAQIIYPDVINFIKSHQN